MAKTVTINQDKLLMLKETVASDSNITSHNSYCSELTEAAPEVDEYEIGDEITYRDEDGKYVGIWGNTKEECLEQLKKLKE